jgi:tripartite-type tricarboxylate transporter receptor subunit TctC
LSSVSEYQLNDPVARKGEDQFMRGMFLLLWSILSAVMPAAAQPAAWPTRPVTLVFPFAPGGAEGFIRVVAHALSERFGQPFVIEIRSGAGGAIGSAQVAAAPPDGYTLLVTYVGPAVLNKILYKSIPYDPDTEFEPVVLLSEVPQVIVSSPKLGFKTLADLIAYAKANPNTLTVAHPGAGTMGHLAAALLLTRAGITGSLIGYRGSTPAITDILSGHIMAGVPAYIPVTETVTRLAVTSEERVGFLPDVPTAREAGIDVVASTWGALVGPRGMPAEVVAKLNAAINDFLAAEEGRRQLALFGMSGLGGPPQRVTELMAREKTKWGAVIREAKIKLD